MYESFYGIKERPFSLTPDPAFLYLSRKHRMALSMLEYGMTNEAPIILITGEIGSGKTTLIRQLLNLFDARCTVGLISNTHAAFGDLLQWISMAFGLEHEHRDKVSLYRAFVDFLVAEYAQGRRAVLIIDEAQNMAAGVLEELRVISNINADKNLVLQMVLSGQPELRDVLRQKKMEQFAQRISVDYHLEALDARETREYIQHRMTVAGTLQRVFSPSAIAAVHRHSGGVPRLINALCDIALVYGFAEARARISGKLIEELVNERKRKGLFGAGKIQYDEPEQLFSAAELTAR